MLRAQGAPEERRSGDSEAACEVDEPRRVGIDSEFASLIPPHTAEELEILKESLLREGCRDPLRVWGETGILLDGHCRHRICSELGIDYKVEPVSITDRNEAGLWIIANQLGRRNLATIDRIQLAVRREPLLRAQAKANSGRRTDLLKNSAAGSHRVVTREACAAVAGVSHDTFSKGRHLLEHGVPELLQAVRNDEASIHAAAEVAGLPEDEQRAAVSSGRVLDTAKERRSHLSRCTGEVEWYTPAKWIEVARSVIGEFDIDPASSEVAQKQVKAASYYTKEQNGLSQPWHGRIWLNPPYERHLIRRFVEKLISEIESGNVVEAIMLTNSQTEAAWFQLALSRAACICFPYRRVRFERPDGSVSENGPLHAQTFFYYGTAPARFVEGFRPYGALVRPIPTPLPQESAVEGQ